MASALLHIKDSYYFEVPKKAWQVQYGDKAEFPDVWVRLDSEFQLWEAGRLYDEIVEYKPNIESFYSDDFPSQERLLASYSEWKHSDHANEGKPLARYLEEHYQEWFGERLQSGSFKVQWEASQQRAGDVQLFQKDASIQWDNAKLDAYNYHLSGKILIPQYFGKLQNLYERDSGLCISKFMVIEVAVALILWGLFAWLARNVGDGDRPRGRLWNLLEVFVVFIRDQIARPAIGKHDADRFVPLLLSLFFFVLGCNLMGMLPWLGAPTGEWGTTLALACVTFATVVVSGMIRFGPIGFFLNQVPSMDLPWFMAVVIKPMILVIEILGLCIKHLVLSVRLLANMVAGHIVLLAIMGLAFSVEGAESPFWLPTAFISIVASTLISCLELFVAFLQAYVFTFLSALFIGAAIHHH